jgi:hypothetical protein
MITVSSKAFLSNEYSINGPICQYSFERSRGTARSGDTRILFSRVAPRAPLRAPRRETCSFPGTISPRRNLSAARAGILSRYANWQREAPVARQLLIDCSFDPLE